MSQVWPEPAGGQELAQWSPSAPPPPLRSRPSAFVKASDSELVPTAIVQQPEEPWREAGGGTEWVTQKSEASSRAQGDDDLGGQIRLSQLEEFLAVGRGMQRSCQTLPVTLALWITFVIVLLHHSKSQISFHSARAVRDSLREASYVANNSSNKVLRVDTIEEPEEIMEWIQGGLLPALTVPGQRFGQVAGRQQLVGFVRVAQTRGANTSSCAMLSDDLRKFYNGPCHAPGGEVGSYGPPHLEEDRAFIPLADEPRVFNAWLEVGRDLGSAQSRMRQLQRAGWLDLYTQEVRIHGVFLNSEDHVYSDVEITFVLHREGLMDASIRVWPVCAEVFIHWSHILADIIWAAVLFGLAVQAVVEVRDEKRRGLFRFHMHDPYVWLDWLVVLTGFGMGVFFLFIAFQLDRFDTRVKDLGEMPKWAIWEAPDIRRVQATLESREYQGKVSALISTLQMICTMTAAQRLWAMAYSLLLVLRFFRGFSGQPRIAVLVQTLLYSMDFLFHYLVIFTVVFANFALGNFVLFGETIGGWSAFGSSVGRLVLILFGNFDHDEFDSIDPFTSGIWLAAFYILAVLLLLNLLTSAILHSYADVRLRLGESGLGLQHQVLDMLRSFAWSRSYEGSRKSTPDGILLQVLSSDTDPTRIERLGRLLVDRRLCSREDVAKAEKDPTVNVEFLVSRGCDPAIAERLLERCSAWRDQIAMTSSPAHRLMLLVARQMTHVRQEAERFQNRTDARIEAAAKAMDRLDLKHAKCQAVARRVKRAQEVPAGWTAHYDAEGRRYLRHEETGLTSWTLPRGMI